MTITVAPIGRRHVAATTTLNLVRIFGPDRREIFEHELDAWMREPDRWPAKRTRAMFHQGFDVELAPMLIDLCDEPLEDDVG